MTRCLWCVALTLVVSLGLGAGTVSAKGNRAERSLALLYAEVRRDDDLRSVRQYRGKEKKQLRKQIKKTYRERRRAARKL